MQWTFRILSTLLRYPDEGVQQVAPVLLDALERDAVLDHRQRGTLQPLVDGLIRDDLLDLQERYVALFDRGRALSLHLFEHVHGESRDRGQAMVDLRQRYIDAGLEPEGNELPDYLPMFLDYCATLPDSLARDTLAEPGVVLIALSARLADKGSDYAPVFALLCDIAGLEMDEEAARALPPAEDPETLEELDAQWEEEEIRFTADATPDPTAACPQVSAILDRMREPATATIANRRN